MNSNRAYKIWDMCYGSTVAYDAFGLEIRKESYGDYDSKYGWSIDHIWPLNGHLFNGSDEDDNIQALHITTNIEKGSRLKGKVQGIRFHVKDVYTDQFGKKVGDMYILNESGEWEHVG